MGDFQQTVSDQRETQALLQKALGVLGMLQQIIAEAKQLEADAIKAESDAQKAYETFVKDTNADLHKSCDFTLNNFDIRQEARDQEVEALRQAKAILSGAKFTEFLQKRA